MLPLPHFPMVAAFAEERAQLFSDQGKTEAAVAELRKLANGKNEWACRSGNLPNSITWLIIIRKPPKRLDAAEKLAKDDKTRTTSYLQPRRSLRTPKEVSIWPKKNFAACSMPMLRTPRPSTISATCWPIRTSVLPEAQDYIKRAVDLEPGNYAFLDSLGWVYFRLNKLDDAEQQLTRSLQLSAEKDPTIHDHMGDVYFKQGKLKLAISQWQSSLKAFNASAPGDIEPEEVAKVQKKLDSARVKLAKKKARPSATSGLEAWPSVPPAPLLEID